MPFGMKNSPATFKRLINMIICGLDNYKAYIDDVIRLSKAKLTINLAKSEFCHATLTFLGTLLVKDR